MYIYGIFYLIYVDLFRDEATVANEVGGKNLGKYDLQQQERREFSATVTATEHYTYIEKGRNSEKKSTNRPADHLKHL
jgi:hypothetical protein